MTQLDNPAPANSEIPGQLHLGVDPNEVFYQQVMDGHGKAGHFKNPEVQARVERTQSSLESVAIGMHELHLMPHEEQLEILEDVVGIVFDEDEAATANIAKITAARDAGNEDEAKDLVSAQKTLFNQIRREVAFNLGIEIEDIEKENEEYRGRLVEKVRMLGDADEETVMRALGFLVPDEQGDDRFNYPEDVFPPHINDKWKQYAISIKEHMEARLKFDRKTADNPDEVVQLDAIRTYAHNNLAKAVSEFLATESWDFERSRKFVNKMVEKKYPKVDTSESKITSQAVIHRLRTINALGLAVTRHHTVEEA